MGEAKRRKDQMGDDYWKGRTPMDLKFAMVADHVAETKEGKLVIVGVFDTIYAHQAPATHPSMFAVAKIETSVASGSNHRLQMGMWDEDGREVMPLTPPMDIQFVPQGAGRPLRAQLIANLAGISFPAFGDYELRILINGRQIGDIHLRLQKLEIQR